MNIILFPGFCFFDFGTLNLSDIYYLLKLVNQPNGLQLAKTSSSNINMTGMKCVNNKYKKLFRS